MEIRRTTRRCIHTFMHTLLPRIRRCWRGPRSMSHRFKNGAHHETKILAITSVSKRKHSSGNRISWTSGQGTEVHKIMVTTCMIFKGALTLCCDSWRRVSQVDPSVFLLDGVAPLYAAQRMTTSPLSRVARARAARFLKLNLARKTNLGHHKCIKAQALRW